MIRVLHVLDGAAAEPELRAIRLLLQRAPSDQFEQCVAATDPRAAASASQFLNRRIHRADRRLWLASSSAPALRKLVRDNRIELIHAWGPGALAACRAAGGDQPIVVSGIRVRDAERAAAWLRQIRPAPVVIASSQVSRGHLARFGIRADHIAVIRDAVDFAEITRVRQFNSRSQIVGDAGPVILAAGPAHRDAGQFETLWAAAMLQQLFPAIRVVVPEGKIEIRRLARLAVSLGLPEMLIAPAARFSVAELVTAADVLVIAPREEADPYPIGWAMAAGVPVIGVARRSVAELIADRSNGLLCINNQPRKIAASLLRLLEDPSLRSRLTETARGQAFEVFGARAYIDNVGVLYSNMSAGRMSADGIHDTAMVA